MNDPETTRAMVGAVDRTKREAWSNRPVACQNCGWHGTESDASEEGISDIFERVSPGEPMPAGECPKCGSLVHLTSEPAADLPAVSEDFAKATGQLADQLDGCIRTLCAVVDKHTGEIAALPPRHASSRRHDGHTIWRARAFQLRGLQLYFEALSRSDYAGAATVQMDRYGEPGT